MSWGAKSVEEQRLAFISAYNSRCLSMSALCRAYDISRKTGYKWVNRYEHEQNSVTVVADLITYPIKQSQALKIKLLICVCKIQLGELKNFTIF